jgi:transcriptional regulator of met regulon
MTSVKFYVGLHQPADAQHFDLACISIKRLWRRKKPVACGDVLVDSGAFTELLLHGRYRHGVEEYAAELHRLHTTGVVNIAAAVAQDYMCEPFILAKTGLTIEDHQRLTIERYDALVAELERLFDVPIPFHVMPVLQGFAPQDYVNHVRMYGDRLKPGMWVGVGSVCKRQGDPRSIMAVLQAIAGERPDLLLHGFGVKKTALLHPGVRELLATADSMAWSFAARKQGRDANDWHEARNFADVVNAAANQNFQPWQMEMFA